jgi:hypothetical protein
LIHNGGEVPIVTVCEALKDPGRFAGATIIVVGRSVGTDEGSWLDEDCGMTIAIEGRHWPTAISTAYVRSSFAPPPQMPKHFKWDKRLLRQKLDQVKETTRLRDKSYWLAVYGRLETQLPLSPEGYGHLNAAPAQLIGGGFLKLR